MKGRFNVFFFLKKPEISIIPDCPSPKPLLAPLCFTDGSHQIILSSYSYSTPTYIPLPSPFPPIHLTPTHPHRSPCYSSNQPSSFSCSPSRLRTPSNAPSLHAPSSEPAKRVAPPHHVSQSLVQSGMPGSPLQSAASLVLPLASRRHFAPLPPMLSPIVTTVPSHGQAATTASISTVPSTVALPSPSMSNPCLPTFHPRLPRLVLFLRRRTSLRIHSSIRTSRTPHHPSQSSQQSQVQSRRKHHLWTLLPCQLSCRNVPLSSVLSLVLKPSALLHQISLPHVLSGPLKPPRTAAPLSVHLAAMWAYPLRLPRMAAGIVPYAI